MDEQQRSLLTEIIAAGATESQLRGCTYIGTEHLLLGILRRPLDRATGVLGKHGITYEVVSAWHAAMLGLAPFPTSRQVYRIDMHPISAPLGRDSWKGPDEPELMSEAPAPTPLASALIEAVAEQTASMAMTTSCLAQAIIQTNCVARGLVEQALGDAGPSLTVTPAALIEELGRMDTAEGT